MRLLKAGKVVGFPTDTVYGLAALASDDQAVRQVFEAKGRPLSRALILMVAQAEWLDAWAEVDDRARSLMRAWWPGPLTLVLPAKPAARPPLASSGPPPSIAARIPDHPVATALLRHVGSALATTSANRSGEPPAMTAADAAALRGIHVVIDSGRAPGGLPSTLLDLTGNEPRVLRPGPISEKELFSRMGSA